MTSTFLSQEEVRELTGYKKKHHQKKWLKARRIPFVESAAGNPCVMVKVLEQHFTKKHTRPESSQQLKANAERWASGQL